jgi:hypothetical protein
VPRCSARSFWAPGDLKVPWRLEEFKEIYNFRRASVVGVPIAKVANTLASWLCWMAGSYVGRLDTKTTSLRSAYLKYLGTSTALPT